MEQKYIKPPVEIRYADELEALKASDTGRKPDNWYLSPKAVRTFILGSEKVFENNGNKIRIGKKFFGNDALVERCIITLAGSRGLMLVGEPGTAKTMLSELLSAAISGTSTNTVQGTAGTTEDMIKYSWNYALLLAKGPVKEALVPSPLYVGMSKGIITRFEEITRTPAEIQDSLISVMSDKVLNVPELEEEGLVFAKPGFNIIGTANIRDKGVNEMSSALKRRFNFETVNPVKDVRLEKQIIISEVAQNAAVNKIDMPVDTDVAELLAITYHELREGISDHGIKIEKPSAVMSTAEAVSVFYQTMSNAWYYEENKLSLADLTQNLNNAVCKDTKDDLEKLKGYFNTVIKSKSEKVGGIWTEFYETRKYLK
ncbi:MAG: AAA family ATPase [Clostridia bacterium]|nr:AAA family ATPase [Clostridia bacterium]